jgi:hypothetical protein
MPSQSSGRSQPPKNVNPFEWADGRRKHEKRKSARVPYQITIQAAPFDLVHVPTPRQFHPVVTRDLSTTGISFYATIKPATDHIVLMLGDRSNPTYLTAQIVRFQQGYYQRKRQFLVGCAFTGRIEPETVARSSSSA